MARIKPGNPNVLLTIMIIVVAMLLASGCATTPSEQPAATAVPQGEPGSTEPSAQASEGKRDYILIGRPNPTTGVLAGFGEGCPWAEDRILEAINKEGGVYIKELDKKLPMKMKVVDTESSPTKAAEVATKLILDDQVDMMVAVHTPDVTNPVSAVCERYQVPCISIGTPIEAWLTGGPYEWSHHIHFSVDRISDVYLNMWDQAISIDPSVKKIVGGMFPNDPDGSAWAEVFSEKMAARGYTLVDTGRFPYGTKDYSAMINAFKEKNVDIVVGVVPGPDFATAWRQMHQQGFVPKVVTMGKGIMFPTDATALGENLAIGIGCEVWWHPENGLKSSVTGETSQEICDAWTKETGKQWTMPLGINSACMEIAYDVLKRAQTLDKNELKKALAATDFDSVIGRINYNDQNYGETPLVGGQWFEGEDWPFEVKVTNNVGATHIPVRAEYVVPVPR